MRLQAKSATLFIAIGLALYAALFYAADRLVYRTGKSNPLYKIAVAEPTHFDWVILDASHAMPLDFADFNGFMEKETGLHIVNLASPGSGPLYNRFVFEQFLTKHRTRNLLYIVDSFAFYHVTWNEERFTDAKLLGRTPFDAAIASRLLSYCLNEGVDFRALLDYVTGFSKINNRARFERDIWEGEKQFGRVFRPSPAMTKSRISYLYPKLPTPAGLARYLEVFDGLVALAQQQGVHVLVIKVPVPPDFRGQIPNESEFDAALSGLLARRQIAFLDLSAELPEPRFYFDTDHLNRAGVTELFEKHLKTILLATSVRQ
ncbi:hypothetical protein [Bradyrhizobium sp.]|uniref:hypothetical protein n=1 Tax=Bradyrhizobium sp. TaxID=376 RepID=UPI002D4DC1CF|nr:hypothetical protein [Bradyrhizobium sp.]HZR72495.1 hypothetical protein [Bradyrhizobium sp.]